MNTRSIIPFLIVLALAALTLTAWRAIAAPAATTITVNSLGDTSASDGVCTLREAISAANTNATVNECAHDGSAGMDTIQFSVTGVITLTSALPDISDNLTLAGPSAANLIISGANIVRVFMVNAGVTFNLQNLTVANGVAGGLSDGGGVDNSGALNVTNVTFSGNSASNGGGIYSTGTLNVTNSTFSGNSVGAGGGGIYGTGTLTVTNSTFSGNSATYGGGIVNWGGGTLTVTNSTFSGNTVLNGGGGIYNNGTLNVTNSTFSGNSAPGLTGNGGGIYNWTGAVTVTNSTFSGNSAGADVGDAGGIRGPATLKNTIVANSTSGMNCSDTITDGGGNLQFGGVANSCGATIPTADPVLSALANNGGPTQTMALGAGSAAIDAADYTTCMAAVGSPSYGAGGLDQRGQSRSSVSSVCDIGAFELQASDGTPTPTPLILTVSDCSAPSGAPGRLVDVVAAAPAGYTIVFSCSGTITLTATITIDKNLTLDGTGQSVTISGGDTVGVFGVNSGKTFNLQNLAVANGLGSSSGSGGGVFNSGTLNVTNVTFSGNSASYAGGGIYSTGTLNVTNSAFSGNSSGSYGGGIANWNGGTLNVTNSTFSGNSGGWGGGISNWSTTSAITNSAFSDNSAGYGGGVYNWQAGTLTVTNSTFSGNSGGYGGGLYNSATLNVTNSAFSGNSATSDGGGINNFAGTSNVTNSTFSGNSATSNGGGIYNYIGTSTVMNSTFSGNSGTRGGGIYNASGTLNVTNSTFSSNSATYGGGLYNSNTLNVTNSTFSGNSGGYGGGLYNSGGTSNVTNSTFSGNSATSNGGGLYNSATLNVTNSTLSGNSATSDGGGIYDFSGATMNLKNSVVANAPAGGNCSGTITNQGGNLQFGGTVADSCGATIPTADPKMSAFANNGGPTQTMALGAGSAAIDAADYTTCMAAVGSPSYGAGGLDQRGQSRSSVSSVCDIGAFELQAGETTPTSTATHTPTFTPTNTPTNTGTATPTNTPTPTPTNTGTATPTNTLTPTPTNTAAATPTSTLTPTPTNTAAATSTSTLTPTPTNTSTPTVTPTPTRTPAPPPSPRLRSPANNASVNTRTPTLDWTDSARATVYDVQVRRGSKTGALVVDAHPALSKHKTPRLTGGGTKHFWRVRACNGGGCSAWTRWWSFTVTAP